MAPATLLNKMGPATLLGKMSKTGFMRKLAWWLHAVQKCRRRKCLGCSVVLDLGMLYEVFLWGCSVVLDLDILIVGGVVGVLEK